MMTEYETMIRGELYDPSDSELTAMRIRARKLARKYNNTDEDEPEKQTAILKELLSGSEYLPGLQARYTLTTDGIPHSENTVMSTSD